MSYKLVIAEKPSVAQSIAKVIGADKREDGYLEGNGYIVSWCVGHLVELASPESYDEKYEKWRYEDLPILPSEWNYQIAEANRKQFGILKKLMEREDVTGLVEATDAGREGELIFQLVYDQAKCKKPFERLWIFSMEDQAISDGFSHLKNGREYDDLYQAALCRERAAWIVGMNATRLFSRWLGEAVINVLDNAVKYSPCGSKIFIRLQKRNDLVRMEIEDQGIGIPQNEYHKIFQRFYRGSSKEVMEKSGTGIGLFLSREIIEKHEGTITVTSGKKKKGSTFVIQLPYVG